MDFNGTLSENNKRRQMQKGKKEQKFNHKREDYLIFKYF